MNGLPSQTHRIAVFLLALPLAWATCCLLSASAEEKPAWQSGISTWNGQGYVLPAVSGAGAEFKLPNDTIDKRPYTIPTNPDPATAALSLPGRRLNTQSRATDASLVEGELGEFLMPTDFNDRFHSTGSESIDVKSGTENWQAEPTLPSIDSDVDVQRSSLDFNAGLNADPVSLSNADFSNALGTPMELPAELPAINTDALVTGATAESDVLAEPLPPVQPPLGQQQDVIQNASEAAPLQADVTRWYEAPHRWMKGWDSHAELGLDGSDGNANTLAFQAGMELKRKTDRYTLSMDVNYRQANNRNKTTEENGRFNLNFDRLLGNTSWSAFVKHGMEWDRFKPFDLRLNLNAGAGYYWARNDDTTPSNPFWCRCIARNRSPNG